MVVGAGFLLDGVSRSLENARSLRLGEIQREFRGRLAVSEPDREPFECYVLCCRCRNIQPETPASCPGCGGSQWIDLGLVEMTRQLREAEEYEEADPPAVAKWIGRGLVLTGTVAMAAILWALGTFDAIFSDSMLFGVFGVPMLFGIGIFALWAGTAAAPGIAATLHRWRGGHDLLLRWAIPSRPIDVESQGQPAVTAPVTAPLSKQPCVAWVLTAHLRGPGERDARLVLVEHRSAPMRLGERDYPADTFAVESRPRVCEGLDDAEAAKIVRQRGLQWSDGEFTLREAFVPMSTPVRVVSVQSQRGHAHVPALDVAGR